MEREPDPSHQEEPLAGLKVLELHAIGPVPFAGMMLRQLGAQVARVSPPQDPGLGVAMPAEFDLLNRGKATLALDLKNAPDAVKQPLCSASRLERAIGVIYRCVQEPASRQVTDC